MTDEARAGNVVEALCRVMRDLPGIGKDMQSGKDSGGPKYNYRGIEQVTPHTQELFAKHGVVFTPHVRSYEVRDIVINGKPWTDIYELVEYTVYGPGGVEDRITVGPILAIGRDNSDKGGNKSLTQAMKYALLQSLQISDPKDDPDQDTHVADGAPQYESALPEQVEEFQRIYEGLSDARKNEYLKWRNKHRIPKLGRASFEQAERALDAVRALRANSPAGDETTSEVDGVESDTPAGDTSQEPLL